MIAGKRKKFKAMAERAEVEARSVYGSGFSLVLDESEVRKRGFSILIAKLLNEEKAIAENGKIYLDPYYEDYGTGGLRKPGSKKKLFEQVKTENFRIMINQAELAVRDRDGKPSYYFKIPQKELRRFGEVIAAAQLIRRGLGHLENGGNEFYLAADYYQQLEEAGKIKHDLSGFRTLLGENSNIKAMVEMIEGARLENGCIFVTEEQVQEQTLKLEMFVCLDLGIAKEYQAADGKSGFLLEPEFSSWLLSYMDQSGDRISFGELESL